jgi:DNA-binding IclR family transcriptional regulator
MAVAVRADQGAVVGVISIAGPSVRLTPERMSEFAPELQAAAEDLSGLSLPDHRPVPA